MATLYFVDRNVLVDCCINLGLSPTLSWVYLLLYTAFIIVYLGLLSFLVCCWVQITYYTEHIYNWYTHGLIYVFTTECFTAWKS